MPQTELVRVVKAFREAENLQYADIGVSTDPGKRLIAAGDGRIPGVAGRRPRPAGAAQGHRPRADGRVCSAEIFLRVKYPKQRISGLACYYSRPEVGS